MMNFLDESSDMKFECKICYDKANYNYKTCTNPAYCYKHKTSDMVKFGRYTLDDILSIFF
jgi:hypothetical protein